ncbi:MAG TPA: folylpolyglutamate synthase/dihydrofolate synthase family protein [Chitinophagales bacterium]|nr:folylpolyglutamate synthase/dihydrofolate synthase family protein [Chitinophagales bacterium]
MTYAETLDYLYLKLPMFSRIGEAAIKKDLTNTISLCNFLGNPQQKIKTIHIAGTNGKGSTAHILASVLQEAGYKTGLYTSPHILDFRERIKINGKMCPEKFVVQFTEKIKPKIEEIQPSFFEITVAMAFDYFAKKKVDIAIIETGLGGRLDSTNIIHPVLSVITNISYDHQYLLGNTLAEIALEKAGIIKFESPVIIGRHQAETDEIFIQKAKDKQAHLEFAEDSITQIKSALTDRFLFVDAKMGDTPVNICSDLNATYQTENIRTALAAIHLLQTKKILEIKDKAIQLGFSNVRKNTHLLGRWQWIAKHPKIVVDVGHNEDGIRKIKEQLKTERYRKLHIIYGAVKDKEVENILELLPKNAIYYFTEPQMPRKLDAQQLHEKALQHGLQGSVYPHPKDALGVAKSQANEEDLILIMGSFFVVSEIL